MREKEVVAIRPPNLVTAEFVLIGTAPYVQNKFSRKAREQMMAKQAAGPKAKKGSTREARDFDASFEDARHISREGWDGIPVPSFRSAMVSACRVVGFKMTHAKLAVFVEPDGFDRDDGTPLVPIMGEMEKHTACVRNETGVADVRVRPMWREGWKSVVRVRFDADLFGLADVANLLARAGAQVGIGEGRPDSKRSAGIGWGTFRVQQEGEK